MNYEELVKALRWCDASFLHECGNCLYVKYKHCKDDCMDRMLRDATAAIEALNRLLDQNTQRCEALRKQLREAHESYERHLNELEAQLPKRGKWIRHPEVKNIYGGVYIECPFCGEKYVVQNVSDEKFCRNCGADLRAKMEAQE